MIENFLPLSPWQTWGLLVLILIVAVIIGNLLCNWFLIKRKVETEAWRNEKICNSCAVQVTGLKVGETCPNCSHGIITRRGF